MTYKFLLESVWHPPLAFADAGNRELPAELELQARWFAGAFGREFRTVNGEQVRIVQFGQWNRSAGPDFGQVAIELDGKLRTGDLELDPGAREWDLHGHATNPAFERVVLHVNFDDDARRIPIITRDGREVPQVVISRKQVDEAMSLPPRDVAIASPGRCLRPLRGMPHAAVAALLNEAARHRARRKAARLVAAIDACGRDEALWQATAESLGYRNNVLAMRVLAQRAQIGLLRGRRDHAESVLFGIAGFLSSELHQSAPPTTREHLRALWETWWRERSRYEPGADWRLPWQLGGQRPANHPHRRVGALAALADCWPEFVKISSVGSLRSAPVIQFLREVGDPFWSFRHTLTSAPAATKVALIGRERALELLANHLIPLAIHEERMTFQDYYKLRHSAPNDQVKRCALRLFGSLQVAAPWMKRLCHHQALLQVYHDFCLQDFSDCADCPFPEQLAQWR